MQRPLAALHKDLQKSLPQGFVKDLDLHARTPKKNSQNRHKRTQEPPTKVFIQAPLRNGICKIFTQGLLSEDLTRISTRSSVKGAAQGHVTASKREPVQSTCTWTSHKSHFAGEFRRKMAGPKTETYVLCQPAQSKCT
jgi:hypothetical protein